MKYSKILVSLMASSLLLQAQDSEVEIDFNTASQSTSKHPTWHPSDFSAFKWDQTSGKFIIDTAFSSTLQNPPPPPNVVAIFHSDKADEGTLTLKNFSFISGIANGATDKSGTDKAKLPTEDLSGVKFGSTLTIKNASATEPPTKNNTNPFKAFVLGGYKGNTGTINLYAGTNLRIEDFQQTTFKGNINVNSGKTLVQDNNGKEKTISTSGSTEDEVKSRKASLEVKSVKDYSTFDMQASLNLETYNNDRTKERAVAEFKSDINGNTKISGSVYIADKAEATFKSSNLLEVRSSIRVDAQEAKKITQDHLGNQSVKPEDLENVKKTNLTLEAKKITIGGDISVGTGAKELVTKLDSNNITKIDTYASDIGSTAKITATAPTPAPAPKPTTTKPEGWVEEKKAQIIQSGGSIRIGKNSDVILRTINQENAFENKEPSKNQEYAMTITHVSIEEQKVGNTLLNFDAQTQIQKTNGQPKEPITGETKAKAGKILLNGSFDLSSNARALIQSFDGIDVGDSARFNLSKDSLLWLKGENNKGLSLELKGSINANGGALVVGDVYTSKTTDAPKIETNGVDTFKTTLTNLSTTTISSSMRSTTEQPPSRPPLRGVQDEEEKKPRELDPSGVFLLGKSNTFDNQGRLVFDGGGNLSTMTSRTDGVVRDILITNTKGKKGMIQANGAKNAITSSGSITLLSQDIALSTKTLDDEKKTLQEGELILYSASFDPSSYIQLGKEVKNSGKDKVSVSGGTLKIASKIAGVKSYNLRLTKADLDLTSLASVNQLPKSENPPSQSSPQTRNADSAKSADSGVGGAFVNLRKLELGGNVNIYVSDSQGIIANGEYSKPTKEFQENLAVLDVQGSNQIISRTKDPKDKFSLDNYAIINLKSNSSLYVGGDINHSGSLVFSADQFGIGSLVLKGNLNIDMTNHQDREASVNPLVAINHTNFYSLSIDQVYMLVQTQEGNINYRIGGGLLTPDLPDDVPTPRDINRDTKIQWSYDAQKALLKSEIEDYLNGKNAYEGNENKLGIFLNGVALVGNNYIGFGVVRSEAISKITIDGSPTGVIDQYMEILKGSDGPISEKKTQEMISALSGSDPKALQALNNALEAQNGLELGILKDIGAYHSASLINTAQKIQDAMRTVSHISRPIIEDFRKMKVIREIAVQNRMVRSSNPYTAEMELEQIVGEMSPNFQNKQSSRQANTEPTSNKQTNEILDAPAPFLFDNRIAFKNSFWLSAITSTSKTSLDNSSLYGMSAGYEYMPTPNILLGIYGAYGYSNYKADTLKNSAHNIDLSAYVRLYYGASEIDVTFSYIHGFNQAQTQLSKELDQSFDFGTDSFDLNLRYGYIFKTPLQGFFLKPLANFTFYGIGLPTLVGEGSSCSIILDEQMQGGLEFGLGLELRQYLTAFSYIYLLPSFEYNLYQSNVESSVAFVGAYNKMHYGLSEYGKWDFSLYAGGEGYVNQAFSINVSAGYRGALDAQEHNLSISAGLKYKF